MTAALHRLGAACLALALAAGAPARAATPEEIQQMYLKAIELMTQGRHEAANVELERLIALAPNHAGAWLELALSQCTLGRAAAAEQLFREIEVRFAPSTGILEVINTHRAQGCKPRRGRHQAVVSLAVGRDDNVNHGASNPVFSIGSGPDRFEGELNSDFLPKRDSYLQASLEYTRELSDSGTTGFALLRSRRHNRVHELDTDALLLGLNRPFQAGGWKAGATATASLISLDRSLYQRQFQLQGRVTPPLPLPRKTELQLHAALGRIGYLTRQNFNADTGEAGATLSYRGGATLAQVMGGAMVEHGDSVRLGGNRHGWYTSVQYQRQFGEHWGAELGWTRQDWNSASAYSPGLIDVVRDQSTRQWRAALAYAFRPQHSVQLEYRRVDNTENISLFQYNSRAAQLTWRWTAF